MYLIYVIEKLIGRYGTIKEVIDIKTIAPSKKLAIEWIEENKEEGKVYHIYHIKKSDYYFGRRTW